jgi:glycosyltransferase involved in cell wall biosynthesis
MRHVDAYDFDDALFVGSTLPWNRRYSWLKQEAAHCRTYLSRARLVIAGNEYLADYARHSAQRVEVIPSCVDPSIQPLTEHAEREVVRVGWIGSVSTSAYLRPVVPVFERLNAHGLRAKLVVVGGREIIQAPWVEHRRWSLETERRDLATFDIGIMPMPDNDWTRGKCGYKLLQYFAAGVPAVASPVGVNRTMLAEERGRLAGTEDEWLSTLTELVKDAKLREEMGKAARVFVEREYSYQRWAPELAAMLREL